MAADLIAQIGDERLHERLTAKSAKVTRDRDRDRDRDREFGLALFDGVQRCSRKY